MLVAVLWAWHSLPSAAQAPAPTETLQDQGLEAEKPAETFEVPQPSMLEILQQGGAIGHFIIFLSFVAVGFIVEHIITIRKSVLMPEEVSLELEEMIRQGQIDQAIEVCRHPDNKSLISDIVLAGLERYRGTEFGFAEYKAAVEEAGEEQTSRLYRKTEPLSVIGAIAPMLGLLGTVSGMINAFNVIAARKGMARPDELASGISEALVTTLEGLIVAIPAMVAFSYFRNRIDSIVAEAGKRIEQIMMPLGRRKTA
jgi:biopolymer transport protein ExbB